MRSETNCTVCPFSLQVAEADAEMQEDEADRRDCIPVSVGFAVPDVFFNDRADEAGDSAAVSPCPARSFGMLKPEGVLV